MTSNSTNPTPIVLAAGKGERFGRLKQLVKLNDEPVLRLVLRSVGEINWTLSPLLILGYQSERITNAVDTSGFRIIENDNWQQGLSTSVKTAVTAAPKDTSGYLFFLGDMPFISSHIISEVLDRAGSGASIVAPDFRGQRGFPVYLDRPWQENLMEISGDKGARELIRGHPDRLTLVSTEDRGVIMDLDEQSDLTEFRRYLAEEGTEVGI